MEDLLTFLFVMGVLAWLTKMVGNLHKRVKELERKMDEGD